MSVQQQQAPGHRFVVGADGSAPSKAALAWVIRQAELSGCVHHATCPVAIIRDGGGS